MNYQHFVDHTILKSNTTATEVEQLCMEAVSNEFRSVCVPPYYVKNCAQHLSGSIAKVVTVVGYPMGYSCLQAKIQEIVQAIMDGADELDVVININAIKNANWAVIQEEIQTLVGLVRSHNKVVKVIIEYELLTNTELSAILAICNDLKPDFVKSSTGNNAYMVTPKDILKIRSLLDPTIAIKASGGIRTLDQIISLVDAGATRIGTSSAIKIFS